VCADGGPEKARRAAIGGVIARQALENCSGRSNAKRTKSIGQMQLRELQVEHHRMKPENITIQTA
jgi:hypothetical protein